MKNSIKIDFDQLLDNSDEAALAIIKTEIEKRPTEIKYFLELFDKECNLMRKEILAQIIITHSSYEPAIKFLKGEMGWDNWDLKGYKGYDEWIISQK